MKNKQDSSLLKKFFLSVASSIVSAVLIALLFFVWHDSYHSPYDVHGIWKVETVTQETGHDEFEGLSVYFDVVLHQSDLDIIGTGEKVAEKPTEGKYYEYERINRVQIELSGNIRNNFLKNDQVFIHWIEHGRKRDSSSYLDLKVIDDKTMQGSFVSTIADSTGIVYFHRKN